MRWINAPEPGTMGQVMAEQVDVLRAQMASAIMFDGGEDEGDEGMDDGGFAVMSPVIRGMRRGRSSYRRFWSSEP